MTRLLVLEDDPMIRDTITRLLSHAGYDVLTASNGREGIGLWQKLGADLVLTDIRMADMDGLAVVLELRTAAPKLPVIIMSGDATTGLSLARDATRLGPVSFLKKPFRKAELLAAIAAALGAEPPAASQGPRPAS